MPIRKDLPRGRRRYVFVAASTKISGVKKKNMKYLLHSFHFLPMVHADFTSGSKETDIFSPSLA